MEGTDLALRFGISEIRTLCIAPACADQWKPTRQVFFPNDTFFEALTPLLVKEASIDLRWRSLKDGALCEVGSMVWMTVLIQHRYAGVPAIVPGPPHAVTIKPH